MIFGIGAVITKLDEVLVTLANLSSRIGVLHMATQADVETLAQAIRENTAAQQAWASNIQTILGNVENALTAAQQQIANGNTVDLTDATNALTDAQNAVAALPVVTDPTVAPTPTPDPNAGS